MPVSFLGNRKGIIFMAPSKRTRSSDYASLIEPTSYLPARTVFGVSELPAGALVQIDAVMSNAESTPPQA
ncbi:hypothetical protein CT153_01925 [Aeromonas veronii]|nr:hypothetical protein CT153_01925 [Aeromonas veronii]